MSNSIKMTRNGNIHVAVSEEFVTDKHRRVAELLHGYDHDLSLEWIPPGSRGPYDVAPWAVVCSPPGRDPYIVCFAEDCDERLLARVIQMDNTRGNVLSSIEAEEEARKAIQLHKEWEERQEAHAIAAAVLRSTKYHYRHGGVDFGELGGRKSSR